MAQTHEPEKMKRSIIEGWMKYNAGTCSEEQLKSEEIRDYLEEMAFEGDPQ